MGADGFRRIVGRAAAFVEGLRIQTDQTHEPEHYWQSGLGGQTTLTPLKIIAKPLYFA